MMTGWFETQFFVIGSDHSLNQLSSVTKKKSPKVYKSCPQMISLEKLKILTPLQKLPTNVGYLGELVVDNGFKKLPKVQ